MSRQGDIAPAPWRQAPRMPYAIHDANGRLVTSIVTGSDAEAAAIAARIVAAVNKYEGERDE